jgi:hypothetical protein
MTREARCLSAILSTKDPSVTFRSQNVRKDLPRQILGNLHDYRILCGTAMPVKASILSYLVTRWFKL